MSRSCILRQGSTPPTLPPYRSQTAVAVKQPAVSVRPYASKIGAEKTTVRKLRTLGSSGAPPETKILMRPPSTDFMKWKIVRSYSQWFTWPSRKNAQIFYWIAWSMTVWTMLGMPSTLSLIFE